MLVRVNAPPCVSAPTVSSDAWLYKPRSTVSSLIGVLILRGFFLQMAGCCSATSSFASPVLGYVPPVPVQVQFHSGSAMTAYTPHGIASGLVTDGSSSEYQTPVTSIGPLSANSYTVSNAAPVSPSQAASGAFSASLVSAAPPSSHGPFIVPAFPTTYSVTTAGPKYGATMGTLPSAINPVGATVLNTVGVFTGCPGARQINQF